MEPNNESSQQPQQLQPILNNPIIESEANSYMSRKYVRIGALIIILTALSIGGYYTLAKKNNPSSLPYKTQSTQITQGNQTGKINVPALFARGSGFSFDTIVKSAKASVLGASTETNKSINVQIYAFEDSNGNGVREAGENALGFMPVQFFDSPFATTPHNSINSNPTGWASSVENTGEADQLIVKPVATKDYYPTTKPIFVSEQNNFAVVGFQKKHEVEFHLSVFAFLDADKNTIFGYEDENTHEKTLFLAPFTFYQQNETGGWDLLPNKLNTTDTGWGTTTLTLTYPYIVKIVAGDLDTFTPSNKEITTSNNNATLIFPYINK